MGRYGPARLHENAASRNASSRNTEQLVKERFTLINDAVRFLKLSATVQCSETSKIAECEDLTIGGKLFWWRLLYGYLS